MHVWACDVSPTFNPQRPRKRRLRHLKNNTETEREREICEPLMVLAGVPFLTSRNQLPHATCSVRVYVYACHPSVECRQWTSLNHVPSPRPTLRREWRGPSLVPFVVARSWMDFDGRTHRCDMHAETCTRGCNGRLYTQLDSLMTRRIQESNSDDGPGYSQPHAAAPRRNCTPTDRRATYRGHISMRAVTSIHAANYYRKRRNCTRPGNWPSRFDLYSTFRSQGTLRGVVFAKFLTRPPHNPRCAISFWKRTHFALTVSRYY